MLKFWYESYILHIRCLIYTNGGDHIVGGYG